MFSFLKSLTRTNLTPSKYLCQSKRHYKLKFKKEPFQQRIGKRPIECDTPLEAVECIKSNMRVFIHGMCATPEPLLNALCEHAKENNLKKIELVHLLTTGVAPQISARYNEHFTDTSLFISSNVRNAVHDGIAEYVPIFLSEIPLLFSCNDFKIDASLIQVSPPDNAGFCSLGVSVDIARSAVAGSNIVIGLINKYMPRTHGDGQVHISQFDYIYKNDHELQQMTNSPSLSLIDNHLMHNKIGQLISDNLIEDRACLQLGIGSIPQYIFNSLKTHKDLGIHTEMFGDALVDLYEAGCITNAYKFAHPGKLVASFVTGTRKVFDFIDDNPALNLLETNFVNDIGVIASNPQTVAINSALEIDITGQVVADSIGLNIYSGFGGQLDFIKGASLSQNGKPVICCASISGHGESKIVPVCKKGSGVVTTRAHVSYVVTENGVVNLFGKNLKERAKLLISIAHPDHQEWLDREAHKRFKGNWGTYYDPDSIPFSINTIDN